MNGGQIKESQLIEDLVQDLKSAGKLKQATSWQVTLDDLKAHGQQPLEPQELTFVSPFKPMMDELIDVTAEHQQSEAPRTEEGNDHAR